MKLVPLTCGEFAMVDDEDFDIITSRLWQLKRVRNSTRKYAITSIIRDGKRTSITMHRFLMDHYCNMIDHWDGNGLNNQKQNLRKSTPIENGRNRTLQAHSSKFKGVSRHANGLAWVANIRINKKLKNLGYFKSEMDAALAYDAAATENFGQFARTNKQMGVL